MSDKELEKAIKLLREIAQLCGEEGRTVWEANLNSIAKQFSLILKRRKDQKNENSRRMGPIRH